MTALFLRGLDRLCGCIEACHWESDGIDLLPMTSAGDRQSVLALARRPSPIPYPLDSYSILIGFSDIEEPVRTFIDLLIPFLQYGSHADIADPAMVHEQGVRWLQFPENPRVLFTMAFVVARKGTAMLEPEIIGRGISRLAVRVNQIECHFFSLATTGQQRPNCSAPRFLPSVLRNRHPLPTNLSARFSINRFPWITATMRIRSSSTRYTTR
jgi:hypothetical protein